MPAAFSLKNLRYLLFGLYLVHGLFIINQNYITNDEMDHWSYGKRVLMLRPEKIYPFDDASSMPVTGLNAIPRAIEQLTKPGLEKTDSGFSDIMSGRYVTLLISLLIGVYIYSWSKQFFGEKGGILSIFLWVFCPNINAYSGLLTTDAYTALLAVATCFHFQRFVLMSGWKNFIFFSISLGISQVTKQSLLVLPLVLGLISLLILIQRKTLWSRWKINFTRLICLALVCLFIINLAFLFRGSFMSLDDYEFRSEAFRNFQDKAFSAVPLPFPSPFIEGFDLVKYMLSLGSGNVEVSPRSYLLGNYFTGKVWYYYPVIIFLKTPIVVLAMLLAALIVGLRRFRDRSILWGLVFPLLMALGFVVFFIAFNSSQHGIRHLLMIYPLIYIALGSVVFLLRSKVLIFLGLIYSLATFYYYFPNLLSYTNEFIPVKRNAYKVIASSNIDYGQCNDCYEKYIRRHPGVTQPDSIPSPGNYIIGINYYLDLDNTGKYTWMQRFEPYGHVNHCLLLIRVEKDEIDGVE